MSATEVVAPAVEQPAPETLAAVLPKQKTEKPVKEKKPKAPKDNKPKQPKTAAHPPYFQVFSLTKSSIICIIEF
jgi:histone H1/5